MLEALECLGITMARGSEIPRVFLEDVFHEVIFRCVEAETLANTFINALKDGRIVAT